MISRLITLPESPEKRHPFASNLKITKIIMRHQRPLKSNEKKKKCNDCGFWFITTIDDYDYSTCSCEDSSIESNSIFNNSLEEIDLQTIPSYLQDI